MRHGLFELAIVSLLFSATGCEKNRQSDSAIPPSQRLAYSGHSFSVANTAIGSEDKPGVVSVVGRVDSLEIVSRGSRIPLARGEIPPALTTETVTEVQKGITSGSLCGDDLYVEGKLTLVRMDTGQSLPQKISSRSDCKAVTASTASGGQTVQWTIHPKAETPQAWKDTQPAPSQPLASMLVTSVDGSGAPCSAEFVMQSKGSQFQLELNDRQQACNLQAVVSGASSSRTLAVGQPLTLESVDLSRGFAIEIVDPASVVLSKFEIPPIGSFEFVTPITSYCDTWADHMMRELTLSDAFTSSSTNAPQIPFCENNPKICSDAQWVMRTALSSLPPLPSELGTEGHELFQETLKQTCETLWQPSLAYAVAPPKQPQEPVMVPPPARGELMGVAVNAIILALGRTVGLAVQTAKPSRKLYAKS